MFHPSRRKLQYPNIKSCLTIYHLRISGFTITLGNIISLESGVLSLVKLRDINGKRQ